MKIKLSKKIIICLGISLVIISLLGCGDGTEDKLKSGIDYLNNEQYEEAKEQFSDILEKEPDNEEALTLNEIITKFISAKEEYEKDDLEKSKEYLDEIPEIYSEYNIKDKIDDLKKIVEEKLDEIKKLNESLDYIKNLLEEDKLDDAKQEIEKLNEDEMPEEKIKVLEDLKTNLNLKLTKKEDEERLKKENEEKLEKEKLEKEKAEAATEQLNKENQQKKAVESTKKSEKKQGDILYQNKNLGIQMKFPRAWEGLYRIEETNTSISVFAKQQVQHFEMEGFLFTVKKWESENDEDALDTLSPNKRYIVAKGIKYVIGGPTGVMEQQGDPEWNNYKMMSQSKSKVGDTIVPIN